MKSECFRRTLPLAQSTKPATKPGSFTASSSLVYLGLRDFNLRAPFPLSVHWFMFPAHFLLCVTCDYMSKSPDRLFLIFPPPMDPTGLRRPALTALSSDFTDDHADSHDMHLFRLLSHTRTRSSLQTLSLVVSRQKTLNRALARAFECAALFGQGLQTLELKVPDTGILFFTSDCKHQSSFTISIRSLTSPQIILTPLRPVNR